MKKTLSVFATLALLFFGAACVPQETNTSETDEKEGNTETSKTPSVTVGANNISAISVVLKGKANLTNSAASDLQVGFQYSKSAGILPSNSITIEADDSDANYNYSSCVTGLDPETTYYFRSVVRQKGVDSYGETLSFTTKDVASLLETLDATEVEATTATLNAKLDLTDVRYIEIDYGFYCGDTEQELNNKISGGEIADKSFSATMTDLPHKTQYWYKAYVSLDSQTFYGDKKTFTTAVIPVESVTLDKTEHVFHTIGNILALTATILPSDATDKSIEWASDHPEVATVDSDGNVTAVDNGAATITVTSKDLGKTASCAVLVSQYVTEITLDKSSLTLYVGENETISVTSISPSNAYDKTYSWTSSDESVASVDQSGKVVAKAKGSATIMASTNDGSGIYATSAVTVKKPVPDGAVDLGLSVYWARSNLSSSGLRANPEDYGDYYAWGETEPYYSSQNPITWKDGKTGYNWASYSLCNGSSSTLTKYNNNNSYGTVDNKTVLELVDDAAHAKLGGNWRMPTDEEWAELRNNCTWTWTNDYNGTGVAGSIVTSNVDGYKDKSIFFPAAGYRLASKLSSVGSYGCFWSSSLKARYPDLAYDAYFSSSNAGGPGSDRCHGRSVRPVTE